VSPSATEATPNISKKDLLFISGPFALMRQSKPALNRHA
jgi:hypothetical protein